MVIKTGPHEYYSLRTVGILSQTEVECKPIFLVFCITNPAGQKQVADRLTFSYPF